MTNDFKKAFSKGGKLSKIKDILLLGVLAIVLIIVVYKTFFTGNSSVKTDAIQTNSERKLSQILSKIEGVGEADVMINEDDSGAVSVVVVCEGAKSISVMMDIREAVCAALGTEQKAVKIYLLE